MLPSLASIKGVGQTGKVQATADSPLARPVLPFGWHSV